MRVINRLKRFLFYQYFFTTPTWRNAFTLSKFYFCDKNVKIWGMKKNTFSSMYISLKKPIDDIFSNFKTNTRNEIRKAQSIGIKCSEEVNLNLFVIFYNSFASTKNRRQITVDELKSISNRIILTKTIWEINNVSTTLAMHLYISDKNQKTCMLFMSASLFRNEDKEIRKIIGHANRYLHFFDIDFFKNRGYEIYDLGGYALNAPVGSEQHSINNFKDQFGGNSITYFNFDSYLQVFFFKVLNIIRGI